MQATEMETSKNQSQESIGLRDVVGGCCLLLASHGLTREVCVVATPISTDLSAFPLLLEGDIMLPGGSSGRQ